MAESLRVGTYEGTGAAINIELGWKPEYVRVINTEDGDASWEWFEGMTAAHAIFEQSIADDGTTSNVSLARITSNGITAYDGDRDTAKREGFTVGTALSESGKTFRFVAMRSSND